VQARMNAKMRAGFIQRKSKTAKMGNSGSILRRANAVDALVPLIKGSHILGCDFIRACSRICYGRAVWAKPF
jgi:hypothetical protein